MNLLLEAPSLRSLWWPEAQNKLVGERKIFRFALHCLLAHLAHIINYFTLTGYCITKPEVIFRLEQGEEPWILEEEFLSQSFSGELMCIKQVNIREFIIFL